MVIPYAALVTMMYIVFMNIRIVIPCSIEAELRWSISWPDLLDFAVDTLRPKALPAYTGNTIFMPRWYLDHSTID